MKDGMKKLLEDLTGEKLPLPEKLEAVEHPFGPSDAALGYSQLNELLLLAGLDRVHETFFSFLLKGDLEYVEGSGFESFQQLRDGVDQFRRLALMLFGNVKFAFKTLSTDADQLAAALANLEPIPESH